MLLVLPPMNVTSTSTSLFGLLWATTIWIELGYSHARFGQLAWALWAPTGLAAMAVLLVTLWISVKTTRAGSTRGLWYSAATAVVGLGIVVAVDMLFLPEERTIQASFQTRTASGGLFKDALVHFSPLLVFILPAFHAVVRLQRELAVGAHDRVRALLTRQLDAVWPQGMLYIPPSWLGLLFLVLGAMRVVGTNYMLDALTPGPYAQLFTIASYAGTGLWLAIVLCSLAWYAMSLNELRREVLAAYSLTARRDSRQI
jgi:hypothetical protein